MRLRIVATGGTLDKRYDLLKGELAFGDSHVAEMLARARVALPVTIEVLPLLDSLDMVDADRERVAHACKASAETRVVVVHGTDTMCDTARVVARALEGETAARTIVFTGAMIPYNVADSDALFNLGFACAAAQLQSAGTWVAINGQVFAFDQVHKDRSRGVFVAN